MREFLFGTNSIACPQWSRLFLHRHCLPSWDHQANWRTIDLSSWITYGSHACNYSCRNCHCVTIAIAIYVVWSCPLQINEVYQKSMPRETQMLYKNITHTTSIFQSIMPTNPWKITRCSVLHRIIKTWGFPALHWRFIDSSLTVQWSPIAKWGIRGSSVLINAGCGSADNEEPPRSTNDGCTHESDTEE